MSGVKGYFLILDWTSWIYCVRVVWMVIAEASLKTELKLMISVFLLKIPSR